MSDTPRVPTYVRIAVFGAIVVALFVVGIWFRLRYVYTVGMHIDEFTTLWSAQRILQTGLPLMPSGVIYTRGIPSTYVTAAFLAIGGQSYTIGRLASVFFGMAAVLVVGIIGKREWNGRVGWLAALGLALLPEAITWSGRARMYAPFLLLATLTIWSAYRAIQSDQYSHIGSKPRLHPYLQFGLLFVLTLAVHEATILLLPPIVLGMIIWRGWRNLFRPPVLGALALCGLGLVLRFLLETLGQPGYFESIQSQKAYIDLQSDVIGALDLYIGRLLSNARKYWSIPFVIGLGVALIALAKSQWRISRLERQYQSTLFFALQFLGVLALLVTVVGSSWRDSRSIFYVLACWLLVAAAGSVWIIDHLTSRPTVRWFLTGALTIAMLFVMWPMAQNVFDQDTEGYENAFTYVKEQRHDSDVVMTPQPPACAWIMGEPCDYYARTRGYQEYSVLRNDRPVDRWTGADLLTSADQLQEVLKDSSRVWFVTDVDRLVSRYNDDFIRMVTEQFDQVYRHEDTLVLMAEGWREPQEYHHSQLLVSPIAVGPLDLVGWEDSDFDRGRDLIMVLLWRANQEIDKQINTSVRLVGSDGVKIAQDDSAPAGGIIPTSEFDNITVPDSKRLSVPSSLPDGHYRLELVAYDGLTHDPITDAFPIAWYYLGPEPVPPVVKRDVFWEEAIKLIGHDTLPDRLAPGAVLPLRMVWQAIGSMDTDYTTFVHLVDEDNNLIGQQDRQPRNAFYPTSGWQIKAIVGDHYELQIPPSVTPGEYQIFVGWYDTQSGQRLHLSDGNDGLEIGRIQIE